MSQVILGKIIADFETSLATAMAIGATSVTIQSATDDDGVALPTGRYFLTLDGNNSSKEHISCTLTGTNITDIKTLSRQGIETSGCLRTHRVGAKVVLTDFAHIKKINDLLDGTTQFDPSVVFAYSGTASITGPHQFATKDYVDGVAVAGSPNASTTVKGVAFMSTGPSSATGPIAVGSNDARLPTQEENDALAGTSGTPSSTNKFVTNDDTSSAGATGKVVRATATGLPAMDGSALTNISGANVNSVSRKVYINATGVSLASSTGVQGIWSITLPGGTLGTNNAVKARTYVDNFQVDAGATVSMILTYGATAVASVTATASGNPVAKGFIDVDLVANSSTTDQVGTYSMWLHGNDFFVGGGQGFSGGMSKTGTATTVDSTQDKTLKLEIQFNTSSSSNSIVTKETIIEKIA